MANSTRRSFMTVSAFAAAPFFIKAEKKSGNALPIVGEGDHTYKCIHDWDELPAEIKYGNTHSVCVPRAISTFSTLSVRIKFVAPHGAIFDHSGNIFIGEYVEIGRVTKLQKIA